MGTSPTVLVDGDPTVDISLMEDPSNFSLIMRDGRIHKLEPSRRVTSATTGQGR